MKEQIAVQEGCLMPIIGLGTWKLKGDACKQAVTEALEIGYRHFDTAHEYDNQKEVGKGLEGFPREELFVTSKIPMDRVDSDDVDSSVRRVVDQALDELKLDYLDLYLIHYPDRTKPMAEVMLVLEKLKAEGLIRSMGVSNFTKHHLEDLLEKDIRVDVNQIEFHPYLYQKELLEFSRKNKIVTVSYRSLGKGALIEDPVLQKMTKHYPDKTVAQILLRWLIEKNIAVIPKSSSRKHLTENFALFDFALTKEDTDLLDSLNQNRRFCEGADWSDFAY